MSDVFFFKQKTAYEMRISDWSSDVCASGLGPLGGAEGAHHHAGGTQLGNEEMRQPIAADLVVEHVDPEAVSGAPREPRLEVAAEIVIAQNVDLQQKVVLCRFDRLEHGGKGFLAVLQQLDAVAAGERQSGELLEYPQVHRIRRQDGAVAAFEQIGRAHV